MEAYYHANADDGPLGVYIPATEHSVMCMEGQQNELETMRRLITEIYPDGIVSVVADSWDYWKVITKDLVKLKDIILQRDGKVVIRPDSGDPIKIVVVILVLLKIRLNLKVRWNVCGIYLAVLSMIKVIRY